LDETDGRSVAKAMGLKPTGVLSILSRSKKLGNSEFRVTIEKYSFF
jgi:predicted nucleic acid-binding protein